MFPNSWVHYDRHVIYWATVCKTVRPMLSDRCPVLSCLSVTFVYCGQTVIWMKMKPDTHVGLGPDHVMLDGDPAPLLQRGIVPPNFRPLSVGAKRLDGWRSHLVYVCMDVQDLLAENGGFGGKIGEIVVRCWPRWTRSYFWGCYLCESRSRNATERVRTDRQTHTRCDRDKLNL